ncbi:hypothetical protein OS493_038787 [Desmophyllum pertusum]|uniref:Uncharacterized protein n=1 Tax=Desmophyllum pertusum TaxID=174260 RepID=A0A9X0CN57_9CNID|nr:hypothetical protein OS493_038787 [Desmophyllum pertusum]
MSDMSGPSGLAKFNVDDLDTLNGTKLKVLVANPSGEIDVHQTFDCEVQSAIVNLSVGHWTTVIRSMFRHQILFAELLTMLNQQSNREFAAYSQHGSCLKVTSPDQLAVLSNRTLAKEMSVQCPIFNSVVTGASKDDDSASINAIALATSSLAQTRNSTMSAVAYRISTILYHIGISYKDATRLNRLRIGMSPDSTILLHHKMGENCEHKVYVWKNREEQSSCKISRRDPGKPN